MDAAVDEFDLIVVGSGPAGEKGAAQAAYFGKRVALVERERWLGGADDEHDTMTGQNEEIYRRRSGRKGLGDQGIRVKKDRTLIP